MTKQEAIQAMMEGKKVTHLYFGSEEYVTINNFGRIETEDGYEISQSLFWHDRSSQDWETGWELVTEPDQK